MNFFKSRSLFSESHWCWSLSGKNELDAFKRFLPVRPGGDFSTDAKKALFLFRALRCWELGEATEVLNFTTKIAPEGVAVELENGDYQTAIPVTKGKGNKRKDLQLDGHPESDMVNIMKEVAHSMRSGSGTTEEPSFVKRSRLVEHRKACTESLMRLFSQKKSFQESGLDKDDPDGVTVIEAEIESCKDRLRHFKNGEQLM